MLETQTRPDIEEQYQRAGNATDLSVEPERRTAADLLIAAGWSSSRVGMALLRLHSEWDASEKPPRPSREMVKALTGTYQRALPGEEPKPGEKAQPLTSGRAQHYAATWHAHEMGLLLQKLKALPAVREQVAIQALKWGMQDAVTKAAAVVRYWLDQTCRTCGGLKWQIVAGTPALSNKPCRACGGSGIAPVPHHQEGRRLANWMDSCVEDARGTVRRNLSAWRQAPNKVIEVPGGRMIVSAKEG